MVPRDCGPAGALTVSEPFPKCVWRRFENRKACLAGTSRCSRVTARFPAHLRLIVESGTMPGVSAFRHGVPPILGPLFPDGNGEEHGARVGRSGPTLLRAPTSQSHT
jgi:hypothetical protein